MQDKKINTWNQTNKKLQKAKTEQILKSIREEKNSKFLPIAFNSKNGNLFKKKPMLRQSTHPLTVLYQEKLSLENKSQVFRQTNKQKK